MNYYDILGVPTTATQGEIEKAYREKVQEMHPDKGGEHESFIELSKAYDTLKDPQKRRVYDTTGKDSQRPMNTYDAAVDTIKILAAQLIMLPNLNPKQDIVNVMMDHIKREVKNAKKNMNNNKDRILAFGQMKSIVHSRTQRNLVHEVLDDAIQKCTNSITNDQQRISVCKACLEILKDYSYGLKQITELK